MAWVKPVKVNKIERYSIGLRKWLKGEPLVSQTVQICSAGATVVSSGIDGDNIWFLCQGVEVGSHKVVINYSTPTRSDSYAELVTVIAANAC